MKIWKFIGVTAIILLISSTLTEVVFLSYGDKNPMVVELIVNLVRYSVFLMFATFYIKRSSDSFREIFGLISLKEVPWKKLLLLSVGLIFLSFSLGVVVIKMMSVIDDEFLREFLLMPSERIYYWPTSLLIVTLVPFVEEIIFRGVLLKKLNEKYKMRTSLVISATIFALIHGDGIFIPQFLSGLLYGMAYLDTRRLIVPILLHMFNNLFAMMVTLLPTSEMFVAR